MNRLLDTLEAHYGPQKPGWPTDPYLYLVWWHCGYPASDAACAKGRESLNSHIGVDPASLLAAQFPHLLRALRLKELADRVQRVYGGDLTAALKQLPLSRARAALKKLQSIADPGADRILLFGGVSPVAAILSNRPHVLARIRLGRELGNYARNYKAAR